MDCWSPYRGDDRRSCLFEQALQRSVCAHAERADEPKAGSARVVTSGRPILAGRRRPLPIVERLAVDGRTRVALTSPTSTMRTTSVFSSSVTAQAVLEPRVTFAHLFNQRINLQARPP